MPMKPSRAKFTSQEVYLLTPAAAKEIERIALEDMDNSSKSAAARMVIGLGLKRYAAIVAADEDDDASI